MFIGLLTEDVLPHLNTLKHGIRRLKATGG